MWYSLADQSEYGQAAERARRVAAQLNQEEAERAAQLAAAWEQGSG
jgi:hypothetical protein